MLDDRRLTGCLKITNGFKREDSSQNMAVAFDSAKTQTTEEAIKTEECALALSGSRIFDDTLQLKCQSL